MLGGGKSRDYQPVDWQTQLICHLVNKQQTNKSTLIFSLFQIDKQARGNFMINLKSWRPQSPTFSWNQLWAWYLQQNWIVNVEVVQLSMICSVMDSRTN